MIPQVFITTIYQPTCTLSTNQKNSGQISKWIEAQHSMIHCGNNYRPRTIINTHTYIYTCSDTYIDKIPHAHKHVTKTSQHNYTHAHIHTYIQTPTHTNPQTN